MADTRFPRALCCWRPAWNGAGLKRMAPIACWGAGVLYGASRPEAVSVNGKKVFIVGGGNSAGQAAMFFSNYAAEVKMLVRGEGLKLSMSQYLIGEIGCKENIEVVPFTHVVAVEGEEHLQRIVTIVRPASGAGDQSYL